ncbi:serine/threonine-protein kinase, partial [Planctomycetota bacterium]
MVHSPVPGSGVHPSPTPTSGLHPSWPQTPQSQVSPPPAHGAAAWGQQQGGSGVYAPPAGGGAVNLGLSAGGFGTGGVEVGSDLSQSAGQFQTGGADVVATSMQAGEVIAGRYEVVSTLGVGGMGTVYRVRDRVRNVEVALKAMLPSLLSSPKALERFRSEAEVSIQLTHDHIVRVHDVHEDPQRGLRFYTMELLDGTSLRAWLKDKKSFGEPVSLDEALEIMTQLLEALKVAHRTTIHRDLKPENIFLIAGDHIHIKVLDFGIAKVQSGTDGAAGGSATVAGVALGTAYYMAPEQQVDARSVDQRADVYSATVCLYELLTGSLPVGRFHPISEARTDLPRSIAQSLDKLALHGLETNPAQRL